MDLQLNDKTVLVTATARSSTVGLTKSLAKELVIGHVAYPAANPLGIRGVGEGGTLGPAAALAGAVGAAVGVAVDRLPITPSSLWELMTP